MNHSDATNLRRLISNAIRDKNNHLPPADIDSGRAEVAQAVIDTIEDAGWTLVPLHARRPRWFNLLFGAKDSL